MTEEDHMKLLDEAELKLINDLWKMIKSRRGEVKPLNMIVILAQLTGGILAMSHIDSSMEDIGDMITKNIHLGHETMEEYLDEGAGHA